MFRVFFPIYFLILSVWLTGESLKDSVVEHFFTESYSEDVRHDYAGAFVMVELILESHPRHEWQNLTNQVSSSNIPIKIVSPDLSLLSPDLLTTWEQAKILVLDAKSDLLIKRITGTNQGIQIGPIGTTDGKTQGEFIISMTVTGLLALLILLWTLYIQRRLNLIRDAAERLGKGDLSARVSDTSLTRVGSLNFHFNSMATHIEQLIDTNRRLGMAVSHELRTPLSRIKFELEYALEENNIEKIKTALRSIEEDSDELELLVNESLLYAKYRQSDYELRFKNENLAQWMFIWLQSFKPLRHNININYEFDDHGVCVDLNSAALTRALNNILHNACRYAKKNVNVHLSTDSKTVEISVLDDGQGIKEQDIHNLFAPFYRSECQPKKSKGFGLGLSISKQIIEKHSGSIQATTAPNGGAKFIVSLPRKN